MFGFIKKLVTGGDGNSGKVLDALIKGGDALVYSKEEKAEVARDYRNKSMDVWLGAVEKLSNESSQRSTNRRIFAWAIVLMVFMLTVFGIIFSCLPWEWSTKGREAIDHYAVAFHWDWAFSSAVIFYFGPHLVNAIISRYSRSN